MKVKMNSFQRFMVATGSTDEVEKLTYLDSLACSTTDTDQDVEVKLEKARSIFRALEFYGNQGWL